MLNHYKHAIVSESGQCQPDGINIKPALGKFLHVIAYLEVGSVIWHI